MARSIRLRTAWTSQAMNGKGTSEAIARIGSSVSRIATVMRIISTSDAKSTRLIDRKLQIRSVSLVNRAIRSPVRLPPKNSSESRWRWAYVWLRRSALTRSLTQART